MTATLLKQPGETLREVVPLREAAIEGRPVTIRIEPRGLVPTAAPLLAEAVVLQGGSVHAILTGGQDGERYLVTALVEVAGGAIHEAELEIAVIEAGWQLPDGGPPYLSILAFVEGVGLDEVVRQTDASGTGRVDRAMLIRVLTDAQAIVDAHLAGRYALPLSSVPGVISVALADLARDRLYVGNGPDGVRKAAAAAMRTLERIQSGAMPLDAAGARPVAAPSDTPILIAPGRRAYPDGLQGY